MERKERLEKILNKNIGNPNHDKEGKFTFAPYKKYPGLQQSVKKLITIKKAEKGLTEKYLKAVDEEREKLFKKYKQDKELEDDELSKWNDGWYMWDEKDKANFSDIDIALSKAIFKESKQDIDVYRTQIDSKNQGKMSKAEYASWSPDLEYVCKWARFLAGYDSKIDIFKNKPTLENIKIIPDVLYSSSYLRNKAKYQEYILENKSSIEAFEHGLSRHDVYEKYINSIDLISRDSVPFDFYIKYNGGKGSGNFNPGQGRGIGKPAKGTHSDHYKTYDEAEHKKYIDAKHKLPKERRTERQIEIIHSLDNMGVLSPEMSNWLRLYGDEEPLAAVEKALSDAEAVGLDLSKIHLEKLRTGSKVWGRAWASGKVAFVGQFYDGNPNKLYHITFNSNGYHTNDSLEGLARHEIGHLISYQNAFSQNLDPVSYCGKIVNECYRKIISEKELPDLRKQPDSVISRYGKTNFNEAIAESWSNPDYSEFTKEVYNMLLKDSMNKKKNNSLELNLRDIPLCSGYGPEFEDDEEEKSRNDRLDAILNGGPGSGNFNPGQGRGIGKPSNRHSGIKLNKDGIPDVSYEELKKINDEFNDLDDNLLLSDRQEKLLKRNYFGTSNYRWVQEYKKALDNDERDDIVETFGEEVRETADELDYLFDDSSLSKDVTLYRGIYTNDSNYEKLKISNVISQRGYSSTSMSPVEASWKRNKGQDDKKNFVLLKIDAKEGSKGIKNPRKEDNELEVLLPSEAKLVRKNNIEEIQVGDSKVCIIEVEYE